MKPPEEISKYLMYPMYGLYARVEVASYSGMNETQVETAFEKYSAEEMNGMIAALMWVEVHCEADLTDVLPDLPHSNSDIHEYCARILRSLRASGKVPPECGMCQRISDNFFENS